MKTIRHFISYYRPYKVVFSIDLLCALTISIIDIVFPLILDYCSTTLFAQDATHILRLVGFVALGLVLRMDCAACAATMCRPGPYHGRAHGKRHAPGFVRTIPATVVFLL